MITHTPKPRITSSGFIPDDDTRRNDEAHAKRTAQLAEEQAAMERDARRYRALRESRNYSAGIGDKWGLRMTAAPLSDDERMRLDSAADAMIDAIDAARGAK